MAYTEGGDEPLLSRLHKAPPYRRFIQAILREDCPLGAKGIAAFNLLSLRQAVHR